MMDQNVSMQPVQQSTLAQVCELNHSIMDQLFELRTLVSNLPADHDPKMIDELQEQVFRACGQVKWIFSPLSHLKYAEQDREREMDWVASNY